MNGVPPIDAVEHVSELRSRDPDHAIGRRRPDEAAAFQTLGIKAHALSVMPQYLDQPATASTEYEQMPASLIGRLGSSTFRLSTTSVSMSLAGSRFSSDSAPRPFHHGIRERGGTICATALPSDERQVQADMRTHLVHRPARDIIPPLGGSRVSFYWI